ncbi:unnamed protein product [Orchesella dallaii]|uniref:Uncharacterized protein n=1 Tax=Orchesella dallaii TaxID=48710 RepID=A0ABP1RV31_9HEXA
MRCKPKPGDTLPFATLIVWTELISGFLAVTLVTFGDDKVNSWAYGIFGSYFILAAGLLYYIVRYVWTFSKKNEDISVTMNWVCAMCTLLTFSLFATLYLYYTRMLGIPVAEMVIGIAAIQVLTIGLIFIGYVLAIHLFPKRTDTLPLVILAFLIVMGNGLYLATKVSFFNDEGRIWDYGTFTISFTISAGTLSVVAKELWNQLSGKRDVSVYNVWAASIALMGGNFLVFVIFFFTQFTTLPTGPLSSVKRDIQGCCIIYSAAADALLLLLCRWGSPFLNEVKDVEPTGNEEEDEEYSEFVEMDIDAENGLMEKSLKKGDAGYKHNPYNFV